MAAMALGHNFLCHQLPPHWGGQGSHRRLGLLLCWALAAYICPVQQAWGCHQETRGVSLCRHPSGVVLATQQLVARHAPVPPLPWLWLWPWVQCAFCHLFLWSSSPFLGVLWILR
jgi:hypothetical protein